MSIRVAIVGVGNCAQSLVEGVAFYGSGKPSSGLAFFDIGGYTPSSLEFVLAYDVDTRKVGRPLHEAIHAKPNCAFSPPGLTENQLVSVSYECDKVKRGALYDGVAPHMLDMPEEESFRITKDPEPSVEDVVKDLEEKKVDVLLNYLPVGSETATRFYVEACLKARVPFVNCIPVFIVSDPYWEQKLKEAGIPRDRDWETER